MSVRTLVRPLKELDTVFAMDNCILVCSNACFLHSSIDVLSSKAAYIDAIFCCSIFAMDNCFLVCFKAFVLHSSIDVLSYKASCVDIIVFSCSATCSFLRDKGEWFSRNTFLH